MRDIDNFIEKRIIKKDGHWIFTLKQMSIGKMRITEKYKISTANRLTWYSKHGIIPKMLFPLCDENKCVNPDHWSETRKQPEISYNNKKVIVVHRTIFWHMDKFNMLDWRYDPPRHRRSGLPVRKY